MVYDRLNFIQSTLYPPTCILCGAPGQADRDLCRGCLEDLPHNRHPCSLCALPLPEAAPTDVPCGECQKRPPKFDRCLTAFRYESPLDHLVGGLKFHGRLSHGRLLADLLGSYLESNAGNRPQLLIPVPLHGSRLRERGFNQALELAQPLGRRLDIPVDAQSCIRHRATEPQLSLDKKARRRNVRGAFSLVERIEAKHVALIDDVVTTGNTVEEIARLLRHSGIDRVEVWAIARRGVLIR